MNLTGALIYLISTLTDLYVTAVLLRLLLQWVGADFYNPLSQFLIKITNPVLVPTRRLIPSIGKLDTASVVVMLLLELLQLVLINLIGKTEFGFVIEKIILFLLSSSFFPTSCLKLFLSKSVVDLRLFLCVKASIFPSLIF